MLCVTCGLGLARAGAPQTEEKYVRCSKRRGVHAVASHAGTVFFSAVRDANLHAWQISEHPSHTGGRGIHAIAAP